VILMIRVVFPRDMFLAFDCIGHSIETTKQMK